MYKQVEKPRENKSRAVANSVAQKKSNGRQGFGFVDNRPESALQRKPKGIADDGQLSSMQRMEQKKSEVIQKVNEITANQASRSQESTFCTLEVNGYIKKFQSGGGGPHAERKALEWLENEAKNNRLGPKGVKDVILNVTKSPCSDQLIAGKSSSGPAEGGCTQLILSIDGKTVNGYKFRITTKALRLYAGGNGPGQKETNAAAYGLLRTDSLDSNDGVFQKPLDPSEQTWRHQERAVLRGHRVPHP